MNETNVEKRLGSIYGFTGGSFAGLVYDSGYLSPSLNTCNGGNRQPMIIENSKPRTSFKQVYIVASRGRDPENPSDRSPGNTNLEQRYEINKSGSTNTITSVSKDNLVLEVWETQQ